MFETEKVSHIIGYIGGVEVNEEIYIAVGIKTGGQDRTKYIEALHTMSLT